MESLESIYRLAVLKTDWIINKIGDTLYEYPQANDGNCFDNPGRLAFNHIFVWMSSFYTGRGAILCQTEKNWDYIKWMFQFEQQYCSKIIEHSSDTMHDLGFLYSLYSVMLHKLTNSQFHKELALAAADTLCRRFHAKGGYIRAWGRMDGKIPSYVDPQLAKDHFFTESKGLAIIDCMMNLPLLFWAGNVTGNSYYTSIAETHADTTMKYFIRSDWSCYHAYRFDEQSGKPLGGCNYCGFGDESFWVRGNCWAVYGFAIAYRYTHKTKYKDCSIAILNQILSHMQDEFIPIWDFRLPAEEPQNKDTSVNAILACAVQELADLTKNDQYLALCDKLLSAVATEDYMYFSADTPGLLKQGDGINVCTSYGDYFYMEALARRLYNIKTGW